MLTSHLPITTPPRPPLPINSRFLILHADVTGENVGVLGAFGHVRVAGAVVHDDPPHQLTVALGAVLHLHQFHHVQVHRARLGLDRQHGVHADLRGRGGGGRLRG